MAEIAGADFLFASGYEILGRNVRLGPLEIDIVARRGSLVVAAEVRTRGPGAFERPFESISRGKRRNLRQAVERLWRTRLERMADVDRVRIDAIAVDFRRGQTAVECAQGIECY
jgi:putative endonuclease